METAPGPKGKVSNPCEMQNLSRKLVYFIHCKQQIHIQEVLIRKY